MTYELIQFGLFKGLPALHFKWGEAGRIKISNDVHKAEELFKFPPARKHILVDMQRWEDEKIDVEEAGLTLGLLRDMGYFVIVWADPSSLSTAMRIANATELWLEPGQEWAQHMVSSIIMDCDDESLFKMGIGNNWNSLHIGKHLERVPKFLAYEDDRPIRTELYTEIGSVDYPVTIQQRTAMPGVRI